MVRYGLRLGLLLLLLAPARARATDLGPQALDSLLRLDPADLPHAISSRPVLEGPILALAAAPEGLLVVAFDAIHLLDPGGQVRWRVDVPEGIQRHAIPRSGRWVAGHSTRVRPDLSREAVDWLVRVDEGRRRELARDHHPMLSRRTGRRLIAWDPLPFSTEGDDDMAPSEGAPPPALAGAAPSEGEEAAAPSLGYRRSSLPRDFLLEEGLLILRSTEFRASGRTWWSVYHYDPDSLEATKLGDGTPGPRAEELPAARPHPQRPDHLTLTVQGEPARLDLLEGTLQPSPRAPPAPPREADASLTIAEVYHLTAGGPGRGLVLVHPEGRRNVALAGRTVRQLVRVPGTGAVFALEESRKVSLLPRERHRVLHRVDLGRAEENLASYRVNRRFQEKLNRALARRSDLEDPSLWKAQRAFQELDALLKGPAPDPELEAQARRIRDLARVRLATRLGKARRVQGVHTLLRPPDSPEVARALLAFDRQSATAALAEDYEAVRTQEDLWRDAPDVLLELGRAAARLNRMDEALDWYQRLARARHPFAEGARAAIAAGDVSRRRQEDGRARDFYRAAVRLLPTSAGARAKLGRVLRDLGESCASARNLAEATHLDRDGEPGGIRATLFLSLRDCGDDGGARRVLDGLRVDQPLHPTYLEWDADLLVAEGHPERARPKLRALLRLDPGNPELRRKLAELERPAPDRGP